MIEKFNNFKVNEMSVNRENIKLTIEVLADIARSGSWNKKGISYGDETYKLIENKITSSDPEDGGADHIVVFKRESDDKYFRFYYSDWDMDYNFDSDFPSTATEVFPKTITTIIFE